MIFRTWYTIRAADGTTADTVIEILDCVDAVSCNDQMKLKIMRLNNEGAARGEEVVGFRALQPYQGTSK